MEKGIVLSPDRLDGITIRPIFDDRDLIGGNTLLINDFRLNPFLISVFTKITTNNSSFPFSDSN